MFAFGVFYVLIAILALIPDDIQLRAFYLLAFPWLLLLLLVVNMPFLASAFRQFKLTKDAKMNHALEHGTIFFLRRHYPGKYKIGGRALPDGFRLNGLPSPEFVVPAFTETLEYLARGDTRPIVSRYCGSMLVTAQGYAIVLLTVSAPFLVFMRLSLLMKIIILVANLAVYLLLRRRLGLWIQRRFFRSVDFERAAIRSIRQVRPKGIELRPTFFVRTSLRRPEPPATQDRGDTTGA